MLRYAPPIYTVIIKGIRFVFIKILILLYNLYYYFYYCYSNVSHSRLRIYCLIHTPLSPLFCLSAPPEGDRPSSIPDYPRGRLQLSV